MRALIGNLWMKMGWLRMPKWLFVWMYMKPAVKQLFEEVKKNDSKSLYDHFV